MKAAFLIGRMLFGGFFLYNGVNHFMNRKMLSQYAGAKGVPNPEIAVPATGALLLFGGASLLLGIKPRYGAAAILAFLLGVSPMMHDFWRIEDPNQRMNDQINFFKNLALLGAALTLMSVREPWPVSVPLGQPILLDRVRNLAKALVTI